MVSEEAERVHVAAVADLSQVLSGAQEGFYLLAPPVRCSEAAAGVTWMLGGRKDVQTRWTFLLLTWTPRLQQCTWTGLKEPSLGQMSLSPVNGAMVMVFLCSDSGRLLLSAPSRKS